MPWSLVEVDTQGRGSKNYAPALQLRFIAAPDAFSAPLPSRFHQKLPAARQPHAESRTARTDNLFQKAAAENVFRSLDPPSPPTRKEIHVSSGVKRLLISPRIPPTDVRRAASEPQLAVQEPARNAPKESPRIALPKNSPRVTMSPRVTPSSLIGLASGIRTPRSRIEEDSRWMQRKNTIARLMKQLQAKNWNSRKFALEQLAALVEEDTSVLEGVIGHLESKSAKTRETAVWAISRIVVKGNTDAVSRILTRIEHTVPQVRLSALAALSQVAHKGDRETVAAIVKRLSHADWQVREVAADALAQISGLGDGVAIEGLIGLMCDKDWRLRPVAIEALETLVDRSVGALVPLVNYLSAQLQVRKGEDEEKARRQSPLRVFNILTRAINPTAPRCQTCTASEDTEQICSKCVDRMGSWINTALLPPHWIAFLMGGHSRLGSESFIYHLDASLYPLIVRDRKSVV